MCVCAHFINMPTEVCTSVKGIHIVKHIYPRHSLFGEHITRVKMYGFLAINCVRFYVQPGRHALSKVVKKNNLMK